MYNEIEIFLKDALRSHYCTFVGTAIADGYVGQSKNIFVRLSIRW